MAINKEKIIGLVQSKVGSDVVEINPGALVLHPDPTNASVQKDGLVYTNPHAVIAQGYNISEEPECIGVDKEDGSRPIWRKWIKCPSLGNAVPVKIAHGVTGKRKLWADGFWQAATMGGAFNYPLPSSKYYRVYIDDVHVYFDANSNGTGVPAWAAVYYTLEAEENLGSVHCQLPKLPNILQPGIEQPSGRLYQLPDGTYKPTYIQIVDLGLGTTANTTKNINITTVIPDFDVLIETETQVRMDRGANGGIALPYSSGTSSIVWNYNKSSRVFTWSSVANTSTYKISARLEYTKTIDSPIDPAIVGPIINMSMVSMCPDYGSMDPENKIPISGGTWTAMDDGYVLVQSKRTATAAAQYNRTTIDINGTSFLVSSISNSAVAGNGMHACGLYQVAKGDVIKLTADGNGTLTECSCYFVPSRLISANGNTGGGSVDLSNYYDKSESDAKFAPSIIAKPVDDDVLSAEKNCRYEVEFLEGEDTVDIVLPSSPSHNDKIEVVDIGYKCSASKTIRIISADHGIGDTVDEGGTGDILHLQTPGSEIALVFNEKIDSWDIKPIKSLVAQLEVRPLDLSTEEQFTGRYDKTEPDGIPRRIYVKTVIIDQFAAADVTKRIPHGVIGLRNLIKGSLVCIDSDSARSQNSDHKFMSHGVDNDNIFVQVGSGFTGVKVNSIKYTMEYTKDE